MRDYPEGITPTLVFCEECSLRVIRPTEEDASEIADSHDSGECPGEAVLERRGNSEDSPDDGGSA